MPNKHNNNNNNNNNNKSNNETYYRKQDPYQNQNAAKNDMRGEFGSTFDVDRLKDQKIKNNTRRNNDLDPEKRSF